MILFGVLSDIGIFYISIYLIFRFDYKNILFLNSIIYVINCYYNFYFVVVFWLYNFKYRKKCFKRYDLCNCDFLVLCLLSYFEYIYGYLNICFCFVLNLMMYLMVLFVC